MALQMNKKLDRSVTCYGLYFRHIYFLNNELDYLVLGIM